MGRVFRRWRRQKVHAITTAAVILAFAAAGLGAAADDTGIPKIAFFGFQLINTSLESTTSTEVGRIKMLNEMFRKRLNDSGHFKILPIPPELSNKLPPAPISAAATDVNAVSPKPSGQTGPHGEPCRR
jgi:hypothetical protein